jgi:hypothetical protein
VRSVSDGSVTAGFFRILPCYLLRGLPAYICNAYEKDLWNIILSVVFRSLVCGVGVDIII